MKCKNKKYSISTKIFINIITLIIAILAAVTVVFNIFMIKSIYVNYSLNALEMTENLNHIISEYGSLELIKNNSSIYNYGRGKQQARSGRFREQGASIALDDKYNVLFTLDSNEKNTYDYNEITKLIKEHKIKGNKDCIILEGNNETYYFVCISKSNDDNVKYVVSFIDISSIMIYSKKINIYIGITVCLAILISIIISKKLSKNIADPVLKLSQFAKQIGNGNFEKCKFDFNEKELYELAEIMNKSVEDLEKYDKEQKIFFQNASHELRTPLMSIKGYTEAIKYNLINTDEAVDIIMDEGNRLEDLIEELIYVSKMDNITKDYKLSEVDIRELLSQCAIKEKPQALKKNVEFIFNFDSEQILYNCDEKSLYRALLNIIDNGVRYAETKVNLICTQNKNEITIIIENDGEKINENDISHIFERFYKGPKGRNGIGLSIVKTVIDSLNGKIDVYNNTDKGVRFIITLPKVNKNIYKT